MTGLLHGTSPAIRPGVIVAWQTRAGMWRGRVAAVRQGGMARVEVWAPQGGAWQPTGTTIDAPLLELRPFAEAKVAFQPGTIEARASADQGTELYVYGDIGPGGIEARAVTEALKGRDTMQRLDVYLSSPGGSPFEGIAIASVLGRWRGRSTVHIDGLAASAASLVALAGQRTHISADGTFMIHRAWTLAAGDRNELEHTMQTLDHVDRIMASIYARKTGMEAEELLARMSGEWWMDADTALKFGFVDAIAAPPRRNAGGTTAMLNRPWFAHGPRPPIDPPRLTPHAARSPRSQPIAAGAQQPASASADNANDPNGESS
jgi:ATP-dependent protease ClpP protease subunit